MIKQETRVESECVKRLLITFALPAAFSPAAAGKREDAVWKA